MMSSVILMSHDLSEPIRILGLHWIQIFIHTDDQTTEAPDSIGEWSLKIYISLKLESMPRYQCSKRPSLKNLQIARGLHPQLKVKKNNK